MSESWANAPEFVPGARYVPRVSTASQATPPTASTSDSSQATTTPDILPISGVVKQCSYSQVVQASSTKPGAFNPSSSEFVPRASAGSSGQLCSYHLNNEVCPEGAECVNIHGELCQHCGLYCLPPGDTAKIKYHQDICENIKRQEQKYAAAAEASKEITCSICLEVVMEKAEKKSRRFGLLSECKHPFCVECIRKWRSSQSSDNTRRRCPMCRKTSYFIIPSEVWVTDSGEKDQLVQGYKEHLATKDCMHFNRGRDHCPFGANCFYKHALPDGTIISDNVVQRRVDHEENFSISATILLSDFLDELITFQETFQTLFHNRDL